MKVLIYKNGNKIKSRYIVGQGRRCTTNLEIGNAIRVSKEDIVFIDVSNGKDITYECLLNIIFTNEKQSMEKQIDLFNVILCGGFIDYIKELEERDVN